MKKTAAIYVGIDWATEAHQVCVIDSDRKILDEFSVLHSGTELAALADKLVGFPGVSTADEVFVGIEIPRGAIVELLVERGFQVHALNPKQLDRFRDRHSVAGAKDDRRDAFVLADSLRTDIHCFRRVRLDDPLIVQLRELSRVDDDLREELNRMTNRLREQLHRYYVQILELSPSADDRWIWALLELAPTPADARHLEQSRVQQLLKEHRIRRVDAARVINVLRGPSLTVAPGTAEAASTHIGLLIPRLRLVLDQRKQCAKQIDTVLERLNTPPEDDESGQEHEQRDVGILLSLPGIGRTVAATLLAESSFALAERDYHALRTHTGVAPVTKQSGKRRVAVMRQGCNGRLRNAVYHWSRVAVQRDPHSRNHYTRLRARGHSHGRALRGVSDRLLAVMIAMLKSRELYDPTRRQALPVVVQESAA